MRFRKPNSCFAALILLLSGLAAPAAAQDFAAMDMTGMGIYAMEDSVTEAARDTVSSTRRGSGRTRAIPAPSVRLTYKPSIERRRANFAQFVEKTRKKNPEAAASLQQQLTSTDLIDRIGGALSQYGMRTDNVADAYAIWWLNAWLASRQRNDTPPARQIAAVRAQAARAMASIPEMASASDAVKQEMAEANLIQAALLGSMMKDAEGNSTKLRQLAAAVRKGARASGLNLDAMELSDDGFVPSTTGAVETQGEEQVAADASEDKQQVAAAREESRDDTVVYAAAAAAAAGLLGGVWLARGRKTNPDRQG
jgi:hypothetical protein